MRILKNTIDDKLVISIVIESAEERLAMRRFAGQASTDKINDFMEERVAANLINNNMLLPMLDILA